MTITYRDKLTPDEFIAKVAEFMKVDIINIKVLDGPTETRNGEGYRYLILVCRDANVDENKASGDLVDKTANGAGESAGFLSAELGDVSDSTSDACSVAASVGLLCIAGMAAF